MVKIAEYKFTGSNAWGAVSTTKRTAHAIEQSDVGKTFSNYLGYRHRDYKIQPSDVGRLVEYIEHNQPCWSFCSKEWIEQHSK